jgi:hypothetical protein
MGRSNRVVGAVALFSQLALAWRVQGGTFWNIRVHFGTRRRGFVFHQNVPSAAFLGPTYHTRQEPTEHPRGKDDSNCSAFVKYKSSFFIVAVRNCV